jgi:hypothetical protein
MRYGADRREDQCSFWHVAASFIGVTFKLRAWPQVS